MTADEAHPAPDSVSRTSRRRWAAFATWIEVALWTTSVVALGLAGWMWADGELYQRRNFDEIANVVPSPASGTPRALPEGTPIARLEIPRLGLGPVVVAEGSSPEVLRRAVGHLTSSALPAEQGNVVLAGHRDTFFRPLQDVRPGDAVVLESGGGRKDYYEVEWTEVVEPTSLRVVEDAGYPALTLITCYPFHYLGRAPRRFVVRARRARPEEADMSGGSEVSGGDRAASIQPPVGASGVGGR